MTIAIRYLPDALRSQVLDGSGNSDDRLVHLRVTREALVALHDGVRVSMAGPSDEIHFAVGIRYLLAAVGPRFRRRRVVGAYARAITLDGRTIDIEPDGVSLIRDARGG